MIRLTLNKVAKQLNCAREIGHPSGSHAFVVQSLVLKLAAKSYRVGRACPGCTEKNKSLANFPSPLGDAAECDPCFNIVWRSLKRILESLVGRCQATKRKLSQSKLKARIGIGGLSLCNLP